MKPVLDTAAKYAIHCLKASGSRGHGIHSPFAYHFIRNIIGDKRHYPEYETAEALRCEMLSDNSVVTVEDLGAGPRMTRNRNRTIASIAKGSAKPARLAQLLFRVVRAYQPATIIELGTSLGITTSYLALANKETPVISFEGSATMVTQARRNFDVLALDNIRVVEGNFDKLFSPFIAQSQSIDLLFVDGNHRKAPTLDYFQTALTKVHNDSILIFDDIHWSREMEEAWEQIRLHPCVTCTVDIFWMGFVFFRKEFHVKQHFLVRY